LLLLQAYKVFVSSKDRSMAGIFMEKANGTNVIKRLNHQNFHNVRYVIAMIRDLLLGLAVAQDELGFGHYDLK
jgi:hypothetical protein